MQSLLIIPRPISLEESPIDSLSPEKKRQQLQLLEVKHTPIKQLLESLTNFQEPEKARERVKEESSAVLKRERTSDDLTDDDEIFIVSVKRRKSGPTEGQEVIELD